MTYKIEVLEKQLEVLKQNGYKKHHSALNRGYVKVKTFEAEGYKGRFGEGFKYSFNNPKSTTYKVVEYWIRDKNA